MKYFSQILNLRTCERFPLIKSFPNLLPTTQFSPNLLPTTQSSPNLLPTTKNFLPDTCFVTMSSSIYAMEEKQDTMSADPVYDFWYGVVGEPDSGLFLFGTPTTERSPINLYTPSTGYSSGASRKKSICEHESCSKTPSFSAAGTKPKRCGTHRVSGDVNVRHKLCKSEGCVDRARFGIHGSPATHCGKHRVEGSRNVTIRTCVFPGCTVSPSYSPRDNTKAERCALHKIEGDVITSRETCHVHGCPKRPCFVDHVAGMKHCLEHYNPETDKGILYLMCQEAGCIRHSTFGDERNRPLRCLKHKRATDIDVVNTKCEFENCLKRPSFAPEGSRAVRCKTHSLGGDVNVSGPRCSQEGCKVIVDRKRKRCRIHA